MVTPRQQIKEAIADYLTQHGPWHDDGTLVISGEAHLQVIADKLSGEALKAIGVWFCLNVDGKVTPLDTKERPLYPLNKSHTPK